MVNKQDVDKARKLYLRRISNIYATPNRPIDIDIETLTVQASVQGAELIHEHLDTLMTSSAPMVISRGTGAYISWLDGKLSTDYVEQKLGVMAWGTGERYPLVHQGARRLMVKQISRKMLGAMVGDMLFPGAVIINRIPYSIDHGRVLHFVWEEYGGQVYWSPNVFTIARLVVLAFGIYGLSDTARIDVYESFFGMTFQEMYHRDPAPWDRVGDSTIIRIS